MGAGNCSVEAAIFEAGKLVKGTLTLFNDEYVFGSKRKSVNWENVVCEKGVTSVKSFLRSIDKNYVVFNYNGDRSPQFILEQSQFQTVLYTVKEFADSIANERFEKEEKKRKEEEEKQRQIEEENRIREESKRRAEEEFRQQEEEKQRQKEALERQAREEREKRLEEKQLRIKKEVESCKNKLEELIEISDLSNKAGAVFLDNPYRILGVSCVASNEEANSALDKLKKLSRLKALESYSSSFD